MNNLQIVEFENTPITNLDFEWLKRELTEKLAFLDDIIYTDDNIKSAKGDKAILNKAEKSISDKLKEYKKQCLEPYETIKQQVDEIILIIDSKKDRIDSTVKDYESRKKQEKEIAVRRFYNMKAADLGGYADALYEVIFDKRWLNQSTSKARYEMEIIAAISSAKADIDEIISWRSPFENEMLDLYSKTASLEQVRNKNNELTQSVKSAGLINSYEVKQVNTDPQIKDFGEGTVIRINTGKKQLSQVLDFMRALGIDYEILQEQSNA